MNGESSIDQLKYFLKEMFQFNSNDLDFGIYRIYNLKRKEIENFIDGKDNNCLQPIILQTLKDLNLKSVESFRNSITEYLVEIKKPTLAKDIDANYDKIKQLIIDFEENENEKQKQLENLEKGKDTVEITDEIKDKIYNHILGYFEMYYSNGDFGYNNRSRNLYKVPYEADYDGTDTLFHWKHKGSIYIKTGNSFNAIKFKLKHLDQEFELRLETNEESSDEEVARNNNKDTKLKHYKFNRPEIKDGITRLIFNLSNESTTKADFFKRVFKEVFKSKDKLDNYLFADEKPVFNDLTDDYDKVQEGAVKGIGVLRVKRKTLLDKVNKNFGRGEKIKLDDEGKPTEHFSDTTLETIYNIDQKLNSFYIGNDSDYFIHENLQEFLTNEKERYIKNHILSDLDSILNGKLDNTTIIIAKAFELVSSRIIEFLSAIEEFQKKLFTMKKKVVESEYCLTIDNIDEKLYKEILDNKAQLTEWENLFSVKVKSIADLKAQPTLVLDTKFFREKNGSNPFKDKILEAIENLDEKINGVLINSENYQALILLQEKYRGKVICNYIDPPYNTGSDEFLYKDNFKHSSWMSMIENRTLLAKKLLNQKGAFFVQIDYKELNNLRSCISNIFKESNFVQLISIRTASPAGFKTVNPGPIDVTEYLLFLTEDKTKYKFKKGFVPVSYDSNYNLFVENVTEKPKDWKLVSIIDKFYESAGIKNNSEAKKTWGNNWKSIRDVLIGEFALENREFIFSKRDPHKPTDKLKENLKKSNSLDYVIEVERENDKSMLVYKGGVLSSYSNKVKEIDGTLTPTELLSDFWDDISWAGIGNEGNVKLKNGKKPERLIRRLLEISTEKNDLVLDYFSGSGTTSAVAHKMKRKWIGIEVGKYFDKILKARLVNVLSGEQTGISVDQKWKGGGIFKYIVLEQYEDVLDAIEKYDGNVPKNLPLKYLYRPELNKLNSTLDLSKPFSNRIRYGQPTKEGFVDLVETYNYLQGHEVKSIKTFTLNKKYYKVVETTNNTLVVWREIKQGEDDMKSLKEIIGKYETQERLEINSYFPLQHLTDHAGLVIGENVLEIKVIIENDFTG